MFEYIEEIDIEKFNPYHDRRGRFTTAGNAASFTIRTKGGAYQQNLTSRAIEREKKRMNTPVMTEQEFLVSRGVGDPLTDWINDKTVIPRGLTARQQKVHDENGRKEAEKLYNARQAARKEYKEKVKNGELRDKSQMQQTVERAIYGHEDLAATHAARRMLEKRYGLDWKKLKAQAEKESSTKKSVFDGEYIDEPASFDILKSDDDKHLVFGWASIAQTADGEMIEDIQKDIIEPEDLEDAAYEYVLNFRDTGEEHLAGYRKKGKLIESCVFTEEKQRAMGLAPGSLPVGWWIGFHIEDEDAWRRIKDGTYRMFSIEGKAERVPVEKKAPTGCGVIVLNDDGEVLTGKRTKENVIGGPGGHIEEGETPEEAAIRETYEEFGIVCRDLQSLGVLDGGEKYGDSAIFLCENYSGRVKTDPKEMTETQWLSIEDLEDKYLFLPFAQSIDLYRESNVEKFNPYHDDRGRFTHAGGAGSVTYKPGKSKAHDNALERERIKENFYYGKTRNEVLRSLNDIKGVVGELSYEAPKGIDHKTWQARADAYFSRAKEAETMLAYMDKYGVNNAATDRPKLNPNFKEPAKEPAKPKDNRPKSAFDLEWERKEAETLQQVENMMNEYKPKAKPKPKHEQMGLFGDIGKSIGNYDTIVEIEKFNPYHDSLGRFTTASGAKSFTIRTRGGAYQQNLTNRAIEREKKRTANNGFKSKITGTSHNMPKLDNKYAEEDRLKALDRLEKQFARNYKKPNKEKFDEKMKEYLAETDAKEWDMRANGPMMEVLPRFLKAVSPEKRKKRQEEIKAKLAIDEKTRKERSNKLRAHTRAAQQGTENHRKWLEYDMYLRDKYTDKNNPLDGGRMYQQRATKEELAKLDKLYDAIVTQDKSGRWRVAKSDGEFWDDEWEYTGNNREFKKSVSQNAGVDCIIELYKFNPYHDERGRFATSNSHSFFTIHTKDPGKQHWADFAVAREKERYKEKQDALDKEKRTQERKKKKQKQETTNTVNNKSDFKPAKTKKEAVEYAKNNLGFQKVSYGTKLDVDTINSINKVITEIQAKYPEVKGAVQSLCTTRSNVYAAVRTEKSGNMELQIGVNVYGKGVEHVRKMYEREVSLGRSPKNTTFESILWHEYGHVLAVISTKKKPGENNPGGNFNGDIDKQIDFIIKRRAKTTEKIGVSNVSKKYGITNSQLAEKISEYAKTNTGETFAEAFGEVNGSPTPRKEAVSLVKESGWYR